VLTFDERELGRQMRELAATIVVPTAPPIARRGRFPLWPALAVVAVLVIMLATVSQLATRDGQMLSPGSPAPPFHTVTATATATPSPCPSASPAPSPRATPYPGLPGPTFFPTSCVTHTITGTITELGPQGQQPVEGARVYVHLFTPHRSGHWMSDVTGVDGRYELWGIFTDAIAVLTVGTDGRYVQPCVHQVTVTSDVSVDIEIVLRSAGGAAANAAARRGTGLFLTGVVFGQGPDGTRAPLPDAMVFLDNVVATTLTDADGRYVLCGIPRGSHELDATAPGGYDISKNPTRKIDIVGDTTFDVELKR
jgi:hypothetical protein